MVGSREWRKWLFVAAIVAVPAATAAADPGELAGTTQQGEEIRIAFDGQGRPARLVFRWTARCDHGGRFNTGTKVFPLPRKATSHSFIASGGYTARQRGGYRFKIRLSLRGAVAARLHKWRGTMHGSVEVRRRGRLLERCRLSLVRWNIHIPARAPRQPAPLPAPSPEPAPPTSQPAPTYEPKEPGGYTVSATSWHFHVESDPNDPVGGLLPFSGDFGPPVKVEIRGYAASLTVYVETEDDDWEALVAPRTGAHLDEGMYQGATGRGLEGHPKLDVSRHHSSCQESTGQFVVEHIERDEQRRVRIARIRFESHCDGALGGVRGWFEFSA